MITGAIISIVLITAVYASFKI